jgi:hypothetical protein
MLGMLFLSTALHLVYHHKFEAYEILEGAFVILFALGIGGLGILLAGVSAYPHRKRAIITLGTAICVSLLTRAFFSTSIMCQTSGFGFCVFVVSFLVLRFTWIAFYIPMSTSESRITSELDYLIWGDDVGWKK